MLFLEVGEEVYVGQSQSKRADMTVTLNRHASVSTR
jgi:hypothetical protein